MHLHMQRTHLEPGKHPQAQRLQARRQAQQQLLGLRGCTGMFSVDEKASRYSFCRCTHSVDCFGHSVDAVHTMDRDEVSIQPKPQASSI